ncbi:MAG: helix-turn-helix domain-containing protein [Candidatus Brennerbacteria bacterium]|nr:helix-turn-helix domain-containing protein [Candidatus Brennerbacteria bacterium]
MKSIPSTKKFESRKEWEEHVWKVITTGLTDATSSQGIEKSLAMLVTAYDRKKMIKRAAAVSLLKQGKSYREIGDLLWLSHPTISSIKKSMRTEGGYVSYYERARTNKKEQKQKEVKGARLQFSLLLDALFTVPPPPPRRRLDPKKYILPHGKLAHSQRRR